LGKPESHEQAALGYGASSTSEVAKKHKKSMKDHLTELDKDLQK